MDKEAPVKTSNAGAKLHGTGYRWENGQNRITKAVEPVIQAIWPSLQ